MARQVGRDKFPFPTANIIYADVHKIILVADSCGCICFVENPRNSLFVCLDEHKHLLDLGWTDMVFQHCRWSKSRPMRAKWTKLRTNTPQLQAAAGPCSQGHLHLPWGQSQPGVFDSAGEAQYLVEICEAIIDIFQNVLVSRGFTFNSKLPQSVLLHENPTNSAERQEVNSLEVQNCQIFSLNSKRW